MLGLLVWNIRLDRVLSIVLCGTIKVEYEVLETRYYWADLSIRIFDVLFTFLQLPPQS